MPAQANYLPASVSSEDIVAAQSRLTATETARALAEQHGVDPVTGAFRELSELEQLRREGRVTAEDEAMLAAADDAHVNSLAYGEALRTAVGCMI